MISRQNFDNPGQGHRVCSKHFISGRKTYMNNIPTIVPKNKGKKEQRPRPTSKARNRSTNLQKTVSLLENMNLPIQTTSSPVQNQEKLMQVQMEEINDFEEEHPVTTVERDLTDRTALLELENRRLKEANEELSQQKSTQHANIKVNNFSVHDLMDDPKLFRFYTGLPDYKTFKIILESFGSAVYNLVYIG